MDNYIIVIVTAPSEQEASSISNGLVDLGLIACANRFPVRSVFKWQGEVENEEEVMVICKTLEMNLDQVIAKVKELHSYQVPEIIAVPIVGGSEDYLKWIGDNSPGED